MKDEVIDVTRLIKIAIEKVDITKIRNCIQDGINAIMNIEHY